MHVALVTTFKVTKKEPLATLLSRIHTAFLEAGLGEPRIEFAFSDAPTPGFVSSVDRVLKRHPLFQRFLSTDSPMPGVMPSVRRISNSAISPAAGEAVDFATLLTVATGIPKSFPFHAVSFHFQSDVFGVALPVAGPIGAMAPGILVGDSWWVNGRMRSVMGMTSVEPAASSKRLPPLPPAVATVFTACGKVKNTTQMPLAESQTPATPPKPAAPPPEIAQAVRAIVLDYRQRLGEVIDRAGLPHDLPPALEAMKATPLGETTGPKKPVLLKAFKPMGYDCSAESGTFTLRRRTPGNLTAEIEMDVGTWSRSLTASFSVTGLGFSVILPLPVSKRAMGGGQYAIGDATRWQQIVDNLAALVAEYDRSFVPAIEAAAGPSPEWYAPDS